jgi:enolase
MYNNNFTLADLMMNPRMKGIFPQFGVNTPVQQVYSFAEQTRQVKEHLRGLIKASKAANGDLIVRGDHPQVMARIESAKAAIEQLFNAMPSISKNLKSGTKLYMPYATKEQMKGLTDFDAKITALQAVVDNINFNPNFKTTEKTIERNIPSKNFRDEQRKWQQRVQWRG